jgi:hypothetical protein
MTAGCNCGRTWTGLSQAHCSGDASGNGCHEHFSSVRAFDRHRKTGRCVHPSEVTRPDGGPFYKAETGPLGTTWAQNDPRGHYRTTTAAAKATTDTSEKGAA